VVTNQGKFGIELLRIGQRVLTGLAGMEELRQPTIDSARYRVIHLAYADPHSNEVMTLAFLGYPSRLA